MNDYSTHINQLEQLLFCTQESVNRRQLLLAVSEGTAAHGAGVLHLFSRPSSGRRFGLDLYLQFCLGKADSKRFLTSTET